MLRTQLSQAERFAFSFELLHKFLYFRLQKKCCTNKAKQKKWPQQINLVTQKMAYLNGLSDKHFVQEFALTFQKGKQNLLKSILIWQFNV